MKWTTKARIQRWLGSMPAGESVYWAGQRYVGSFRRFAVDSKIAQGLSLLECLFAMGEDIQGKRTVEIGTGWTPIIPLLFWAYGQSHCDTFDVARLLKPGLLVETIRQLGDAPDKAAAAAKDPVRRHAVERRLRELACGESEARTRPAWVLEQCGIRYHAAADASRTHLADGSVDLVFSNVVLEHVPISEVHHLFDEAARILRPTGYMVHLIDPSDHFSHTDPSVSAVNFLRFSEQEFQKYNSRFLYQNRIRASHWRGLIHQHGFEVAYWRARVDADALERLPTVPLDASFAPLTPEDLCTTAIWVVARPGSVSDMAPREERCTCDAV